MSEINQVIISLFPRDIAALLDMSNEIMHCESMGRKKQQYCARPMAKHLPFRDPIDNATNLYTNWSYKVLFLKLKANANCNIICILGFKIYVFTPNLIIIAMQSRDSVRIFASLSVNSIL